MHRSGSRSPRCRFLRSSRASAIPTISSLSLQFIDLGKAYLTVVVVERGAVQRSAERLRLELLGSAA